MMFDDVIFVVGFVVGCLVGVVFCYFVVSNGEVDWWFGVFIYDGFWS